MFLLLYVFNNALCSIKTKPINIVQSNKTAQVSPENDLKQSRCLSSSKPNPLTLCVLLLVIVVKQTRRHLQKNFYNNF